MKNKYFLLKRENGRIRIKRNKTSKKKILKSIAKTNAKPEMIIASNILKELIYALKKNWFLFL